MNYKIKVIMNLVVAVLVAASGGSNPADNARLERQDPQPEFGLAAAKFHPAQTASQTLSSVLAASTNLSATVYGWAKTWGGSSDDGVNHVAVDGSGNLYVAGDFVGTVDFDPDPAKTDLHTSHKGTIDAYLSKFDSTGAFQWARTWGGAPAGTPQNAFDGRDTAYGVGVDSLGNVYVVGPFRYTVDFNPDPTITETYTSNANSENNIYLSKFTPDGTFQWVRTWGPTNGSAEGYNVVVYGNYLYVVGDFRGDCDFNPWGVPDVHLNHGTAPYGFDAFLSKFDLNGNFQWAKTWGGEGYDDGPGVAVDSAHNVYVAGMYASQTINFDPASGSGGLGHPAHDSGILVDVFLSKFDSNGNFQWVRTWGEQGTEDATGNVAVDGVNNVYVAGRFASTNCDFNPGGSPDIHSSNGALDAFLSKFDSNGTFQWAKTWGGSGGDEATGLAVDGAGHVYVAGRFHNTVDFDPGSGVDNHTSNGQYDVSLSQFDASGNFWAKTWGGSGDDFSGVTVDESGNVYAAGDFVGLVDFDPDGGGDNHTAVGGSDAFFSKFLPSLKLWGAPGDQMIYLNWTVNVTVPVTSTWQISYTNGLGSSGVVTDVLLSSRAYTLSGLTNVTWYTVTLNAMLNTAPILTDTVRVMPAKFVYLPLVRR